MPGPRLHILVGLVIACAVTAGAARASLVLPARDRCQLAGPYASLSDAIEAAQAARERGANPTTFRTEDGYFVRAC
ncbi:hypothetical protein [Roseomonas rosulenta]|uniref:hypothetical protein n=1 Tax=Roseomonas rosulenta TaxID=2748667 RepID=UPI0018DF1587|nr:hypothetical protein [Roseomonas rosulenta]